MYYQNPSSERRKSQFHYDAEQDPENQQSGWFSSTYSKLVAASVGVICVVVALNATYSSKNASSSALKVTSASSKASFKSDSKSAAMEFGITSPGYPSLKAAKQLAWKYIAEPARSQILQLTKFQIEGVEVEVDEDTMEITWEIDGKTYSGSKIEFTLPANYYGTQISFTVTVTAKRGKEIKKGIDSLYSFSKTETMTVKYVRREFRDLTQDDKSRFTSALQKMYSLSDDEGQKLYGAKFHNAEYYLYKHLTGAGRTDCDHWHDGAGLVPHHTAFTLEVEQTLQAIDPTVTIPYWEYGMDAYLYSNLAESPMFAQDFLGEMNPTNEDHRINDGSFWSTVTVPDATKYADWSIKDTKSLNPYRNAYGAMRSSWNNNPTNYIGRHNTTYGLSQYSEVPSCYLLKACFQSSSISDMNYCLNGNTHGPVHIMIGGAWGDEESFAKGDMMYIQNPDRVLLFKILWRMGYTRCPDSCDISDPDSCRCAVPQEYLDKYGAKQILMNSNVYYVLENALRHATDATFLKVLKIIEHPGQAGEMFTSGAPFDPTFWPLHGSMERMLGYKRLLSDAGTLTFDETWGYPEYDRADGAAYLPGTCDWSGVSSNSDLTLPVCDVAGVCEGHAEDDVLEFSNFLNRGETYTNVEFYTFLHPNNVELPYIYDSYEFDYCSEYGYDFLDDSQTLSIHNRKGPKIADDSTHKQLREGMKKDVPSAM